MGPIETRIRENIQRELRPLYFELVNESHSHSVPRNSETHFRLVVVSEAFKGLSRVARQRKIYEILKNELAPGGVHALTQRALTPDEWSPEATADFHSPACLGGSKREKI